MRTFPNKKPKLKTYLQSDWSLDKFLNELTESGNETALRITRTNPHEVTITISCRNSPKDIHNITRALFTLYGISK